jgi:hypothetical protein
MLNSASTTPKRGSKNLKVSILSKGGFLPRIEECGFAKNQLLDPNDFLGSVSITRGAAQRVRKSAF